MYFKTKYQYCKRGYKSNENIAEAHFIVQVSNNRQLNRLMRKMTKLKYIDYVERAGR